MLENEKNFADFEKNCQSVNKATDFTLHETTDNNAKTAEFVCHAPKHSQSSSTKTPAEKNNRRGLGGIIRNNASAVVTIAGVAVFAAACVLLPHIVSYDVVDNGEVAADNSQSGISADTGEGLISQEIRIFREYNGKVGVFFADGTLDFVIDTAFENLPEYDRKLLESGIVAQGQEEIALLAEGLEG